MFSSRSKMLAFIDGLLPIIGTMLIDSVPPAIITSASPTRMRSAAIATACRPEEQKRLMVTPATVLGRPGEQHRDARHVHALLGLGHRAADDRVLDAAGSSAGRLRHAPADGRHQQVVGPGVAEGAAGALPIGVRVAATMYAS